MKIERASIQGLKYWIFGGLLILVSCTQEHLILVKNMNRAKIITLDQVLEESGLKVRKNQPGAPNKAGSTAMEEPVLTKKIPESHKQLILPSGEEFSVNLGLTNQMTVLKSVQGGVKFLKEKSSQDKGVFLFQTGNADGKIYFQLFDLNGDLQKNIYYYIRIKDNGEPAPAVKPAVGTVAPSSGGAVTLSAVTNAAQEGEAAAVTNNDGGGVSRLAVKAIEGMSPSQAIRELRRMLGSTAVADKDKEFLRYKLIELLIDQRSLKDAQNEIGLVQDENRKSYYTGEYLRARKSNEAALRSYLSAISGEEEVQKLAVLKAEDVILDIGSVEKGVLDTLSKTTAKYKADKRFNGKSLIQIGRIYQYLPDIYAAKDTLESVMNGDFDAATKSKARLYYNELKKDFLEYK